MYVLPCVLMGTIEIRMSTNSPTVLTALTTNDPNATFKLYMTLYVIMQHHDHAST